MSELTRRRFLRASLAAAPLVALAPTVPLFLARTARAGEKPDAGRVLVVVGLVGGNDGINTVVPFADEGYAKHRRALRLPREQLVRLDDQVGLHPALKPLAPAWEDGQLAIVQGVSYPNPSRSHFVSREVWYTGRRDAGREREALDVLRPVVGRIVDGAGTKDYDEAQTWLRSSPVATNETSWFPTPRRCSSPSPPGRSATSPSASRRWRSSAPRNAPSRSPASWAGRPLARALTTAAH